MHEDRRKRLEEAVKASYRALRPARKENKTLIERYAGHRYMRDDQEASSSTPRYLNLIHQAIEAYTTMLVGLNPQVHLTAVVPDLKPFARHFQQALNNHMDEIEIGEKLKAWIRDSFFSVGIGKVHMGNSNEVIAEGDILMDPGMPYFSVVGIDDWVHDTQAKTWPECKFEGDMYQLTRDSLKQGATDGLYDPAAVAQLKPRDSFQTDGERAEDMSREGIGDDVAFEDMVDLIDLFIPSEQKIYTFHVTDRHECVIAGPALRTLEWEGTESGPYRKIGFAKVPQNIMPVPMASLWFDLDRQINNNLTKIMRQAKRSRRVGAFTPAGADDAKRIQATPDGGLVQVQDLNSFTEFQVGGVDAGLFSVTGETIKLFDRAAGNLQALLGLGTSADTVGQEKLIHATVGQQGESMQAEVVLEATKVFKELALLLWNDDFRQIPGTVSVEGFPDLTADSTWRPGDREGLFGDYKVQCDVYSLRTMTPAERIQMIEGVLTRMIVPLLPLLQQQGGTVDILELVDQIAELLNVPRLRDIVKPIGGTGEAGPRNDMPQKAPVSNRTYTRRNVSGDNGQFDPSAVAKAQSAQPAT